jgi:hypothetical protein
MFVTFIILNYSQIKIKKHPGVCPRGAKGNGYIQDFNACCNLFYVLMAGKSFVSPVFTSTVITGFRSKVPIKSISFLSMIRSNNRDKMSESTHIIAISKRKLVPMVTVETF